MAKTGRQPGHFTYVAQTTSSDTNKQNVACYAIIDGPKPNLVTGTIR